LLLFALWLVVHPQPTQADEPGKKVSPRSSSDAYSEALIVLTRNCAGCHQAADHPGALFLNKARLSEKQTLDLIIHLIKTSQMPPAHAQFKNTEDGKKLLAFLEGERAKKK
jgi:mono/diheme cytochrome c family protein